IDNNPFSPRPSIPAFPVRLEALAHKVPVFFHGGCCASFGRMAKLLQLYGESAATLYRHFDVKLGSDIEQCGLEQAVPLDSGILPWGSRVVEISVFEKKE